MHQLIQYFQLVYKYHERMENLHKDLTSVHIVYPYKEMDKYIYKQQLLWYKNLDKFHRWDKVNLNIEQ